MKTKYIVFLTIIFANICISKAQITIYTPNMTPVQVLSLSEHSQSKLNELNSSTIASYPQAIF